MKAMFIAAHPTFEEQLLDEPFVNRGGLLFKKLLQEVGLKDFILTYISKKTHKEIVAASPVIVVPLGTKPINALLGHVMMPWYDLFKIEMGSKKLIKKTKEFLERVKELCDESDDNIQKSLF